MARLHDVTTGKFDQFKRVLADAGLDSDLIDRIIHDPGLGRKWVDYLRLQLNTPVLPINKLFGRTPMQGFKRFATRSYLRNWPISDGRLNQLHERVEKVGSFDSTLSDAFSFRPWFGDLQLTFEEMVLWLQDVHKVDRWPGLKSDKRHLRLLNPEQHGKESSVIPMSVDLACNRKRAPKDVRGPSSAGLEVLVAAALYPDWPPAINYDTVPAVWIPGLQAGGGSWSYVPILGRSGREVWLRAVLEGNSSSGYAVPVSREMPREL